MDIRLSFIFLIGNLLVSFSRVTAQVTPDSIATSEDLYKMGLEIFDFAHRKKARELFEKAVVFNPNNAQAQFMAGRSIMLTAHKEKSLPYFIKAFELDPGVDPELLYFIGKAHHYSEEFDQAIQFYRFYRKKLVHSMRFANSQKITEIDRKIFECRNGKIFKSNPIKVTITNLSENVNSEYAEYAPTITADESVLMFTSRRADNLNPDLAADLEYYEDIFISSMENGKFQPARNIGSPINSKYHDASVGLSPEGKKLFLYGDENNGDIYESFRDETGNWSKPTPIKGLVNSPFSENSASISLSGNKLYFTSDRLGTIGGMDIYVSEKGKNGRWKEPENLGPVINTELDEDGAFISANGQNLYFSSLGHYGMGNLDIYRSEWESETEKWGEPINLGYPINSVENDIYFVLSGDEKHGYFSSIKTDSKGEQDIYKVNLENYEPVDLRKASEFQDLYELPDTPEQQPIILKVLVHDEKNNHPLNAEVIVKAGTGPLQPIEKQGDWLIFKLGNSTVTRYTMDIKHPGYRSHHMTLHLLPGTQIKEIEENIGLSPEIGQVLDHGVLNVYFDVNITTPTSYHGVDFVEMILKKNPQVKIEIGGHTDNTGSAQLNKRISQARADNIKRHLVEAGIAKERIIAVGYGLDQPIADNTSEEGRRLNRRTEFTIIEE